MQIRSWAVLCAAAALAFPLTVVAQPLGAEFQVNTYTPSRQIYPSVAYDADGDFVVVWMSNRGMPTYEDISAQRYSSSGAAVGTEFRVNTYTYATQNAPDVAVESNGDFVVVWRSRFQDGDGYGIFGQRHASTGAKIGTEFKVNTFTNFYQFNAEVASDSVGNFVVVWNSYTGASFDTGGVVGQRYDSAGAPIGANFQISTYTAYNQALPAVTTDADGDFVVVWSSAFQDGSAYGVFGQRFASSGTPLGSEFSVNTYTVDAQFAPSVAAENNGDFVVTWTSYYQEGSYSGVFGRRFASGGAAIGGEFQVNTQTTSFQRFVDVASDSKGGFVVTWSGTQEDGSGSGVFGQRFGNDGAALGGEFQINSFTEYDQDRSAIAIAPDGGFIVAWDSYSQDGFNNRGVFAQRFAAPPPCPDTPDPGCVTGFGKGLFLAKEKVAGKEKLIAKLLKGPASTLNDLGDPLAPGGTSYALCVYAGTAHVTTLEVDRAAAATCSGGATACWNPVGTKGFKYKDEDFASDGVFQVQLKSGATKIIVKGKGPNLPLPIASAFSSATSVTLQMRGSDAPQCYGVTLTDIKKQDPDSFKIK